MVSSKRSHIGYVKFSGLRSQGKLGTIVIKLMIAGNDMSLANQSQEYWKANRAQTSDVRAIGALQYFLRLQIAHLFEAIDIIEQIYADPTLVSHVERCDARTRAAFSTLTAYIKNGSKRRDLDRLAGALRNNIAFHYYQNDKMINRAIERGAEQQEGATVRRASHSHDWHFEIADRVAEHIVVRQIWKVDAEENARLGIDDRARIDEVAMSIHAIFVDFMDFAGEFIWKFSPRR